MTQTASLHANATSSYNATGHTLPEALQPEVLWMLIVFSVLGTLGNTLVLYGFWQMLRQNLTSTVFVLTLSGTDLITSLLIIPGTIYIEHVQYEISSDFFCKIYHFLLTSTIPCSIFLMVAIAVDRYLCICKPFLHCMNMKRARTIVTILSILAILIGVTASLFYGVLRICGPTNSTIHQHNQTLDQQNSSNRTLWDTGGQLMDIPSTLTEQTLLHDYTETISTQHPTIRDISTISPHEHESCRSFCDINELIVGETFRTVFQRMYSSLFVIAVVIVSCLYVLIYRAVMLRRKKTKRLRSSTSSITICARPSLIGVPSIQDDAPGSPIRRMYRRISLRRNNNNRKLSRRSDKAFLVNMRTAVTLFIVTLTFIIVFLPGWLMALKLLPINVAVFYLYFLHGVINPFIYAFMNETFRKTVRYITHCGRMKDNTMPVINGISQSTC